MQANPADTDAESIKNSQNSDSHPKYSRSRTGCLTCRKRKKRCDEERPICRACRKLNFACEYPHPGTERQRARRSKYTISEDITSPTRSVKPPPAQSHSIQPTDHLLFPLHFSREESPSFNSILWSLPPPPLDLEAPYLLDLDRQLTPHVGGPHDAGSNSSKSSSSLAEVTYVPSEGINLAKPDQTQRLPSIANSNSSIDVEVQDNDPESQFVRLPQRGALKSGLVFDAKVGTTVTPAPSTLMLKSNYPDLGDDAIALFEYFRDKQSLVLSASPLNYFRSVYLALSLKCRAVLYAILAWASWHLKIAENVRTYSEEAAQLIKKEERNVLAKEEVLATILILATVRIHSGIIGDWRQYQLWAAQVIQLNGGIMSFIECDSIRWLLKNFAYKEILTASSTQTPSLFSPLEFEFIFSLPMSINLPDTVLACCEPLFVILSKVNSISLELRGLPRTDRSSFESIYQRAQILEDHARAARPNQQLLEALDENESTVQNDLFELFKMVVLLHIQQAVLRINSSSLRLSIMDMQLIDAISASIETRVEGILTFPLFIAGICCADPGNRLRVMEMFDGLLARIDQHNLKEAQELVREVWKDDEMGEKYVDWNAIVDKRGLSPSFI